MSDIHTADAMTVRARRSGRRRRAARGGHHLRRLAPGARLTEDALMSAYGTLAALRAPGDWWMPSPGIVRAKECRRHRAVLFAEEVRQIYEVREMLTRQAR